MRALRETAGQFGHAALRGHKGPPGYEVAVEAALGEYGAGVLAENLDEGMKLLSHAEPVAVRLDARAMAANGNVPGKPLAECVEVTDGRYAEAVQRLLTGIYVVERPGDGANANGYVAVTRDGFRLTRTGVSLRPGSGNFAREARLAAWTEYLEALKNGPGGLLYDLREERIGRVGPPGLAGRDGQDLSSSAGRAARARALISREARRRKSRRGDLSQGSSGSRAEVRGPLARSLREGTRAGHGYGRPRSARATTLASATAAADAARVAPDADRRASELRATLAAGKKRQAEISRRLERTSPAEIDLTSPSRPRASRACGDLRQGQGAEERAAEGQGRGADARREISNQRTTFRAGPSSSPANWQPPARRPSASPRRYRGPRPRPPKPARRYSPSGGHPGDRPASKPESTGENTDKERHALARRLKRFGDVNLLAVSQEEGLRERHRFVSSQRADAEAAASELNRIIQSVDGEIESRFSETFGRVREAFGEMVPRMIAGSSGVLELSEEGVEIGLRLGEEGLASIACAVRGSGRCSRSLSCSASSSAGREGVRRRSASSMRPRRRSTISTWPDSSLW